MSVTTNPPYISKVKLPGSNTVYEIKDAYARDMLTTLAGSAINYRGKTKSPIYDGCSDANIQLYTINYGPEINGLPQIEETYTNYTAIRGDLVIQDKKSDDTSINPIEYIWDGEVWQKFGSANEFGIFAYCDGATVTITPRGTISTPTFTGAAVRLVTGNIAVPKTYTSTFSNGVANGSTQYTPAGTITTTTATTENKTTTVSAASSGTATYTPQGTVSKPNITLLSQGLSTNLRDTYIPYNFRIIEDSALSTMVGYQEHSVPQDYSGASPENRYDMQTKFPDIATVNTNQELLEFKSIYYMTMSSLTGDNGAANTNGTNHGNVTVKTADGSYQLETAPTFTGTGKRLVTGNIAVPKTYTSSFTGTEATISIESTVTGTVTTTTATTENKTATVSAASSGTATYTPAGTITTPTFTGIEETYNVLATTGHGSTL